MVGWNHRELTQLPRRSLVATLSGRGELRGRVYFMLKENKYYHLLKVARPIPELKRRKVSETALLTPCAQLDDPSIPLSLPKRGEGDSRRIMKASSHA